jgi:hypothetical protein
MALEVGMEAGKKALVGIALLVVCALAVVVVY